MAMRTITRMFDSRAHAHEAVGDLEAAGFTHDEVSLMSAGDAAAGSTTGTRTDASDTEADTGAGTGATLGTVLGGGAGLLAGLGALAIPGVGPIVAAGWLVATITGAGAGAAAGGLLGALAGSGVDERDAHVYAEGVRRGGTLVSVRAEEGRLSQAEAILARHNPVDVRTRDADYRAGGWSGYREGEGSLGSQPDGTPGNPPGTMASRGVDEALGTNISGAYPGNENGATHSGSANAATTGSQMSHRPDDDGRILPRQPDGAPGNPPGTELTRRIDEVANTNISGAHPENDKKAV
jgi:hypothetical protein